VLKFLADENINLSAANVLKEAVDIVSTKDIAMLGKPDNEILASATKERRIIRTRDKDFLRLVKKRKHYGIIFLTKELSVGLLIAELKQVNDVFELRIA